MPDPIIPISQDKLALYTTRCGLIAVTARTVGIPIGDFSVFVEKGGCSFVSELFDEIVDELGGVDDDPIAAYLQMPYALILQACGDHDGQRCRTIGGQVMGLSCLDPEVIKRRFPAKVERWYKKVCQEVRGIEETQDKAVRAIAFALINFGHLSGAEAEMIVSAHWTS